jgi:hypothetical protein
VVVEISVLLFGNLRKLTCQFFDDEKERVEVLRPMNVSDDVWSWSRGAEN